MLNIVATPIGNLEDITVRALNVLRSADIIAAEDTRNTLKLLNRYEIRTPLISFHEHSGAAKYEKIYELLAEGKQIALVSDAGTPLISDPGHELVAGARERGYEVTSLPGPCAAISALVCSGLSAQSFTFIGFLPRDKGRKKELERVCALENTVILYESPHNLRRTLRELSERIPHRRISICRELTKMYEEVLPLTVEQAFEHYEKNLPRGEFVLVLEGAPEVVTVYSDEQIAEKLRERLALGDTNKTAVAHVATTLDLPKNRVYKIRLAIED